MKVKLIGTRGAGEPSEPVTSSTAPVVRDSSIPSLPGNECLPSEISQLHDCRAKRAIQGHKTIRRSPGYKNAQIKKKSTFFFFLATEKADVYFKPPGLSYGTATTTSQRHKTAAFPQSTRCDVAADPPSFHASPCLFAAP